MKEELKTYAKLFNRTLSKANIVIVNTNMINSKDKHGGYFSNQNTTTLDALPKEVCDEWRWRNMKLLREVTSFYNTRILYRYEYDDNFILEED